MEQEYRENGVDRRVGTDLPEFDDNPEYRNGLPKGWFSLRKLWLFMGPGFLMSIAFLVRASATLPDAALHNNGWQIQYASFLQIPEPLCDPPILSLMLDTCLHVAETKRKVFACVTMFCTALTSGSGNDRHMDSNNEDTCEGTHRC